jgi:glycosyltransferase involved in cell wall biosynthesis
MAEPASNTRIGFVQAKPDIAILLGLYNGGRHLQAQLDSILRQTDPSWHLIVSDDGSTDNGPAILQRFQQNVGASRVQIRSGPCKGFARNFLSLLQSVPDQTNFAALCDQDDVWFSDKLARARNALNAVSPESPALYCAATTICDEALRPLGTSAHFARTPDFRNALVQSIGGGNTMVLNRAAIDLVVATADLVPDPVAHDWWLYQLVTGCGGIILRDSEPVLYYRQHGANLIGANVTMLGRLQRILALAHGRFRRWNRTSLAAITPLEHLLTENARKTLGFYRNAHEETRVFARLRALRNSGVYRQSNLGTLALYVACVLKRL